MNSQEVLTASSKQQGTTMPRCMTGKAETQAHPTVSASGWEEVLPLSCLPGSHPADHPECTCHPGREASSLGLNLPIPRSLCHLSSPRHGWQAAAPRRIRCSVCLGGRDGVFITVPVPGKPFHPFVSPPPPARKCTPCVY